MDTLLASNREVETTASPEWIECTALGTRWRLERPSRAARELAAQGILDRETTRLIAHHVRPGMRVFDIGAGFGWYTLLMAKLVGPTGSVHAFEPSSGRRRLLEWHLEANGLSGRVQILPWGISEGRSEALLASDVDSCTLHWRGETRPAMQERIALRSLDEAANDLGIGRCDFLRLDSAGHEAKSLAGASRFLRRFRPTISLRFDQAACHAAGSDVRAVAEVLASAGYFLHDESNGRLFAGERAFLARCGNFDRACDALAIPDPSTLSRHIRRFRTIEDLMGHFGLARPGTILEDDIDVMESDCDLDDRKRRDAEVLTTLAANATGDILDLGTSFGRSAYKLASNLRAPHRVFTVNVLPEQWDGVQEMVTHLLERHEIGSYYRTRDITNVVQHFADTATWVPPQEVSRLSMAFVDACHDEEPVFRDSLLAWDRLAPGGFLVWHDFSPNLRRRHDWIDAVMRGVERFVAARAPGSEVSHLQGSWIGVLQKTI